MGLLGDITTYHFHREAWEARCQRCGLCCYEREVTDDGEMAVNFASPCEFLDTETNLCTVYAERFEKCPACTQITPRKAASKFFLPPSCAYRRR